MNKEQIKQLIQLANSLDNKGLYEIANEIDKVVEGWGTAPFIPPTGMGPSKELSHMVSRTKGEVYQLIGYEDLENGMPVKRLADVFITSVKEIAKRKVMEWLESGKAKVVHYIPPRDVIVTRTGKEIGGDKWYVLPESKGISEPQPTL